jgi:Na+-transporting methylmalonyl-CoA/oxaloacetate decarboxylase gamma subunit
MAEELKTSSRRPRRVLRWAGIAFAVLILLLVAVWFVGTSEWALKTIILPRVSKAVNATITVEGARLAPFSAVDLRGLQVQTTGTEPVLAAREVRVRYSLRDILKENFNVREIVLEAPVVNHITFPDGTSNLDPITQSGEPRPD